jgi:hypothetical protein
MPEEFEDNLDDLEPEDEPTPEEFDATVDAEAFQRKYGFEHNCRCAQDWDVGNLGVVSVCYLNMCSDALDHLAEAIIELGEKDDEIAALRVQLADE